MITIVVLLISTLQLLLCEEWIVGVLLVLGVRVLLVDLDIRYYSSLHLLHLTSQHLQHEEKDQRYL